MSIADKNYRPITKPRDPINAVYHQLVKLPLGKESDAYIYRLGTEGSENEKLAAALAAQTRKRDRDASESSQTQGEQPKVVDQALEGLRGLLPTAPSTTQLAQAPTQEAPVQMAEGGLAGLDTGDMYNEDSFAAGGIIAFNGTEGSAVDVGRYAPLDDLIELTPEQIDRLSPDQKGAYLRAKQFKAKMAPLSKPETPLYREMMSPSPSQSKTLNKVPGLFGNTTDTLPQSNPMSTIGQNTPATQKEKYDFDLSNYMPKDKAKGVARIPLRKEAGVYESSRQRFLDSLGPDEEREAMRKELKRDKEGLMWATVGDIGKALSKAKAGREFEVFGEEDLVGKMLGRKKDIRSLQRDLANAERNERLMANKYGFESEERVQASNEKRMLTQAALDVREKQIANTGVNALSKMNMGVAKGVQKAKEDWIKNNSMLAGYLSRDPSKASASEKKLIEQAIKSYNAHVTSAENTLRGGLADIDLRPTIDYSDGSI
jgi:hypothetical protein